MSRASWTWGRALAIGVFVLVLALFWLTFAPLRLGGDAIYVVTSGISMEPRFHTGDLAILRPDPPYHLGEIVGYIAPRIGIVMHRIIGISHGRFLMKGDNNDFIDPYHPLPSDIVGRLWLHVPKVGTLFNSPVRREITSISVAGVLAGIVTAPMARHRHHRRKDTDVRRGSTRRQRTAAHPSTGVLGTPGQIAASIVAIVALASVVLGVLSFTKAATAVASEQLGYSEHGTWTYRAPATGDVYAGGAATTGQPIYPKVAPTLYVRFAYRALSGTRLRGLVGTARLVVGVTSSSSGWSRTLSSGAPVAFSGSRIALGTTIDLRSLVALIRSIDAQTGQPTSFFGAYQITVRAEVRTTGRIGPARLIAAFGPSLPLSFDGQDAQVDASLPGSGGPTLAELLGPSSTGSVTVHRTVDATFNLFGHHPTVAGARHAALIGLAAALLGLLVLGALRLVAGRADEVEKIAGRFRSALVAVGELDEPERADAVRVMGIEDLARIAEHEGRMILHCDTAGARHYVVRADTATYVYSVPLRLGSRRVSALINRPVVAYDHGAAHRMSRMSGNGRASISEAGGSGSPESST